MPKLTGPLFSASATGTFAGLIEYRKVGGKAVAAKIRTRTKPRSAGQQERSARFSEAAAAWSELTAMQKNQWRDAAASQPMNGYQLFISEFLKQDVVSPALPTIPV